jgi:predicted O-methyltransferase YrrM
MSAAPTSSASPAKSATAAFEAVPLEPALASYCVSHSSPIASAGLLESISERTTRLLPERCHMVSDSLVGLLMRSMIQAATASSPRGSPPRFLEIGAFTGYSAGWMLDSLPSASAGQVVSLELSEEYAAIVRENLKDHPNYARLQLMVGPALESLRTFAQPASASSNDAAFDFIFVDADKPSYPSYVDFIIKENLLKPTGVLMVHSHLTTALLLCLRGIVR